MLIPGARGKFFFTTDLYDSRSLAYDRLGLFDPKEYRIAFRFTGNPEITGPEIVRPIYFGGTNVIRTNGGGIQYFIREIARVKLVGEPVPLGP